MGAREERRIAQVEVEQAHRLVSLVRLWARLMRKNPNLLLGVLILSAVVLIAILSPVITRTEYTKVDPVNRLKPPSWEHWFGTDNYGRDVFDRTIAGSRISLLVGVSVTAITTLVGVGIALVAGYNRRADNVIMRFIDGMLAFPSILLALALVALLGSSLQNVIIALSATGTASKVRLVRSAVLSLREMTYVEAARAVGAPTWRILLLHIAPNTFSIVIVQATFTLATVILAEATLSFLGAGTPPFIPTWGNIIATGQGYVQVAFWISFFPGLFLTLTVLAVVLIGDALRDYLDPRLRGQLY